LREFVQTTTQYQHLLTDTLAIDIENADKPVILREEIVAELSTSARQATELAIGVSKGDRMDWIVQKATELGVNVISPLLTERSELKLNAERWEKKLNHWREIIISACEQCGRNRLPVLNPAQLLPEFLKSNVAETKLVLDPNPSGFCLADVQSPRSIAILIGPEGGFSAEEINQAKENGFMAWSLGPRILRTETAPVAALSILQSYWGDV